MGIVQILGIGIIAAIFSIIIKQEKPEFAVLVSIATGIIIFFVIADKIPYVIDTFNNIISKTQVNMVFISTLIKIIGIAYNRVRFPDMQGYGEGSIASKR